MGLPFQKLKKLWLLYLFLLFFAFFMFAISIYVYVTSMPNYDPAELHPHAQPIRRSLFQRKNIIGHFLAKGNIFGNFTAAEQNSNNFQPVEGEGAEGRPVITPLRDHFHMLRFFKLNGFNLLASDRIPLNRTLKDYRTKDCRERKYAPETLPTASVIVVFHNEAWSVLLRTIRSVINRTPANLLKEIILVDDASDRDFLKKQLESYIQVLSVSVRLYRLKERSGLVPARLLGAEHAQGDVLMFIDAHCECSQGWLEPLLARIKESRTSVVCPVIDIISDENFSYMKTFERHWGAFNWQLSFRWLSTKRNQTAVAEHSTEPVPTPGMAGGLFAIERNYFFEVGAYDKEMRIWGGENIEMSFRIWQCGGSIEISPCSHVGHVFRSNTPYTFPGGMLNIVQTNLVRAAKVWMDEWADFVLLYSTHMDIDLRERVNVTERLTLRQNLQCNTFAWYLENIWPEHFFPANDRFFGRIISLAVDTECAQTYSTHMKNLPEAAAAYDWPRIIEELRDVDIFAQQLDKKRDSCLRPVNEDSTRSLLEPLTIGDCTSHAQNQDLFVITPSGRIMTNNNLCLTYSPPKNDIVSMLKANKSSGTTGTIMLAQCVDDARQYWSYNMSTQQLNHKETKMCVTVNSVNDRRSQKLIKTITLKNCADINKNNTQKWGLITLPWKLKTTKSAL